MLQQNPVVSTAGNSPVVPVISLSLFAVASGYLMSLIPLALEPRGLSVGLASWLASIFYAGLLPGALFSARVVARFGHRFSLVLFLLTLAVTVGVMAMSSSEITWLSARFFAGNAVAGVFVVIESWLLMAGTEKSRAKRLGLYMASLYGGSALGQLGIGIFGTDAELPLLVIASLIIAAIIPPLVIKKGQPAPMAHTHIKLKEMKHLPSAAYIGCIVSGLVLGSIYGLLPVDLERDYSNAQVGTMMAVVILGGMSVQPFVSWLNSRMEKALLMALCCIAGLLAIAMIEVATTTAGVIIGLFVFGAAAFALYPVAITLACRKLDSSKIVAAAELMLLSYSVGSVFGPVLAGYSMSSTNGLMHYFALCFAATLIYMLISSKRYRRHNNKDADDAFSLDI